MNKDMEFTFWDALITGDSSGAIKRSEKRGQQEVVRAKRLPLKTNGGIPSDVNWFGVTDDMDYDERFKMQNINNKNWTKNQYVQMGIKMIDECDDLLLNVELPEGWEIKATDHSMWNDLFDDKGRRRANYFYKAAFYDRDAFTNFSTRYNFDVCPFDRYKTNCSYEDRKFKEWFGIIKDGETEIYKTENFYAKTDDEYFELRDTIRNICREYLNSNFPNWTDINAYWD